MHRVVRKLQEARVSLSNFIKPRASYNPQEQNPQASWGESEIQRQKSIPQNHTPPNREPTPPLYAPSFKDLKDRVKKQEEEINYLLETIKSYDEILDRLVFQLRQAEDDINSYCMGSFYCNASETLGKQKKLLEMARGMVGDFRKNMHARLFVSKVRTTKNTIEIYLLLMTLIIIIIHDHLKHSPAPSPTTDE